MLRYSRLIAGLMLTLAGPVQADGVAVFASLTDEAGTGQTRARLSAALDVAIEVSQLDIDGTRWSRLHSEVMTESDARALVARAQRSGYSAWYNGTGGSVVTSSSVAAATIVTPPAAMVDGQSWSTREPEMDSGVVTPATGDISHLPLAETFPELDP